MQGSGRGTTWQGLARRGVAWQGNKREARKSLFYFDKNFLINCTAGLGIG